MSWLLELVIGVAGGVLSGVILQRFIPADSGFSSSDVLSGSSVNQQVMTGSGNVITIAGDGNYAHIGDDNSMHVTVVNERVREGQSDNSDFWSIIIVGVAAFVLIAIFLFRNYELILGILIGTSTALLTLSILMVVMAIRARFVSSSLKTAAFMAVLGVAEVGVIYWSCFTLSTGKSGLSMPDLARMLADSSGGQKSLPFAEVFRILFDEAAVPYVLVVFFTMLMSLILCFFTAGMLLREYCERYVAESGGGGVARWVIDHLPAPGKRVAGVAIVFALIPFLFVSFGRIAQQPWLS